MAELIRQPVTEPEELRWVGWYECGVNSKVLRSIRRNKETDMVSQLNKEIYWTSWYAVSGNNIQWTIVTRDIKKANRARKDLTML